MKKIVLGVSGSIAAYKTAELIRELRAADFAVRVVMTAAAKEFITPMTLAVLSGHKVYEDTFDQAEPMVHIDLARWADLILIAPASADILARLAHGLANDLLTSLCLATAAPVWLAPAMNQQMWQHPATQKNLQALRDYGLNILPTNEGLQACGDVGPGRMLEPEDLLAIIQNFFASDRAKGIKVVITAGPTQEAIDPVRYLTNFGSGKMGYALARAFAQLGAEVVLVSGPTNVPRPAVAKFVAVTSAEQMYQAVMTEMGGCHIFIASASVVDYKIKNVSAEKIKKSSKNLTLELEPNIDILREVGHLQRKPFVVGFAAETQHLLKNAEEKLIKKNCDMVIANQVTHSGPFAADDNQVSVLQNNKEHLHLPKMSKAELGKVLVELILQQAGYTRCD